MRWLILVLMVSFCGCATNKGHINITFPEHQQKVVDLDKIIP
jgi:hypothetical protein